MKRTLVAAIVGMAGIATTFGQGHVLISNYTAAPYNQIVWDSSAGAGMAGKAVNDFSLTFQMYYGAGVVADGSTLTPGLTFHVSNDASSQAYDPGAGHGTGGYFINVDQILPNWSSGDTYTFMYEVVTPGYVGQSALWQEKDSIVSTAFSPLNAATVPGLVVTVPEPTTLALAGLGAVGLLFFRRRSK
jgi:hypothetical protein